VAKRSVSSQLLGAELWEAPVSGDESRVPRGQPVLAAGWEDGDAFCAAICTNDVGLAFCRRCPERLVGQVFATGRAGHDRCAAGVRLLAFPAPAGSTRQVAVLRVAPPTPRAGTAVAAEVRVAPATLRRAARRAETVNAPATLAAARVLRNGELLQAWRIRSREAAADRRRTTTAALAQMIVTGEEYYILYQASQRQLSELRRTRRQIDDLAHAAIREQERERARVAHQIHDTAAQSMVSAFRYLETARSVMGSDGSRLAPTLDAASRRMSEAIAEVRAVLAHLMPPGLEELGLATAIETRLERLASEGGLEAEMRGELPRLAAWVEQALYGMTIEAITNAVRHAHARHLAVSLGTVRGRAVIEVRDDGEGFDPRQLQRLPGKGERSGLGLLGIARQSQWLGGRATIHAAPGAGTRIRISVPIEGHRPSQEGTGTARDGD
jgi:two-component system sensor histidine kinase UhpB